MLQDTKLTGGKKRILPIECETSITVSKSELHKLPKFYVCKAHVLAQINTGSIDAFYSGVLWLVVGAWSSLGKRGSQVFLPLRPASKSEPRRITLLATITLTHKLLLVLPEPYQLQLLILLSDLMLCSLSRFMFGSSYIM